MHHLCFFVRIKKWDVKLINLGFYLSNLPLPPHHWPPPPPPNPPPPQSEERRQKFSFGDRKDKICHRKLCFFVSILSFGLPGRKRWLRKPGLRVQPSQLTDFRSLGLSSSGQGGEWRVCLWCGVCGVFRGGRNNALNQNLCFLSESKNFMSN